VTEIDQRPIMLDLTSPSVMHRSSEDLPQGNLYDRFFEQQLASGMLADLAVDATVEAYLDSKPAARGKQKYSRYQRDSGFWSSDFVRGIPLEAWQSEGLTLALARYMGQERVANPVLLERVAATFPRIVQRAVRYSGLVLQQHSPRRTELDQIAASNPDIAELCRVLDIFDEALRTRVAAVEIWKSRLVELSPFELLIYASLYAFERLIPEYFVAPSIPLERRNATQEQWQAINDLLTWKLSTVSPAAMRLNEQDLRRSLKGHLSPYLFPSSQGPAARHDIRAAFETLLDAQVELNSFNSRSADAFSFDDGIEFVRNGTVFEIVERDPAVREAWKRDDRKLERLHRYWFYRAMDEFIQSGMATHAIGRPENQDANLLAYIKAIRTRLRLTEVYGLEKAVMTESGRRVDLFQALLASELMGAFYQQDFLEVFVSHLRELGHWALALSRLALEGLANGFQNRFPLAWSDRKAKIKNIVGWTVSDESPRGSASMAAAVLDFWTSDWVSLAKRLRDGEPGLDPQLLERPILKVGQQLIELPWIFGLQDNSTAAINNLRRLGARRGEVGAETRRIEERLGVLFESRGFRVVLNWRPAQEADAHAGEVDLICAVDQVALVLEVKSTFIRQSQRDAWLHGATTLRKAGQQLRRKVPVIQRALVEGSDLATLLGLEGDTSSLSIHGWIVDTSIECDRQRFSGFLKVSLEEVLIALRDDRHLLDDPDGIFSGRYQEMEFGMPDDAQRQATLYPTGFSAEGFIAAIEGESVWADQGVAAAKASISCGKPRFKY